VAGLFAVTAGLSAAMALPFIQAGELKAVIAWHLAHFGLRLATRMSGHRF